MTCTCRKGAKCADCLGLLDPPAEHLCNDDISFDRSICPCGSMHYYCNECGEQTDPCEYASVK